MQFHKKKESNSKRVARLFKRDYQLVILVIPMIIFYLIFAYYPMYGAIIAFKNFKPLLGTLGSPWAGTKYFKMIFNDPFFFRTVRNTFVLGFYNILFNFPIPILFALCVNEVRNSKLKKAVQTVSYLPYFISVVVVVGLLNNFFSYNYGIVNTIYTAVTGNEAVNFMTNKSWFRTLYTGSQVWQTFGWNSIVFLAALAGVDMELYDSADVDGANRFQRVWHITLPSISNTIVLMLILSVGNMMSVGFEKINLMYNPATYEVADVISTFTYRRGIYEANYSLGAAMGLLNSVVNVTFLVITNWIAKKSSDVSVF